MREPLKVAHVVLSLSPGGLERVVCTLVASPRMQAAKPLIYCLETAGELAKGIEADGGRVVAMRRRPGFDVKLFFRLARLFRQERLRVIHTHGLDSLWYAGTAAWLARVPIRIHTQHNSRLIAATLKDRLKFRLAARAMTSVVPVSREVERVVRLLGAPAARVQTILNGVRTPEVVSSGVAGSGNPVVGVVARLSPEKGVHILLEAMPAVLRDVPAARLLVLGDGPERARLEALAGTLGIKGSVEFVGYREDVESWLPRFDVFVLPSLTEGIPLALLEAMASARAVVATAVGGVPEVVCNGESGILTSPGDPPALAAAIVKLLRDGQERLRLGAAAARRVREDFSEEAMSGAYRRLYTGDPPEKGWQRFIKRHILGALPARRILWRGRPDRPHVALTFDDGPDNVYTPRILDCLRHYDARATFFLVGEKVRREPSVVERILAEGHEIGNHSYSHPDFAALTLRQAVREIETTEDALRNATAGRSLPLFRPPKGKLNLASLGAAWRKGMTVVMWSVDLKDFRAEAASEIRADVARREIRAGDIILYHGQSAAAIDALPDVVETALKNGLKAVPISPLGARR
jgi:glycosyltransferase involved in cell wall biosynthesis